MTVESLKDLLDLCRRAHDLTGEALGRVQQAFDQAVTQLPAGEQHGWMRLRPPGPPPPPAPPPNERSDGRPAAQNCPKCEQRMVRQKGQMICISDHCLGLAP